MINDLIQLYLRDLTSNVDAGGYDESYITNKLQEFQFLKNKMQQDGSEVYYPACAV